MSSLPRPSTPFAGTTGRLVADSQPAPIQSVKAPEGSPNVLLIMLDDVGFGTCSTFGGPVPTPSLDRIASLGLRYNQFHTTALCSPTRATMLTGRNHHSVHMGGIPETANTFPGYDSVIPPEAATVAQILKSNGYATACFGKWHLTPMWEQTPAGPFDRWPTGLGFERYYGIINAEASQWEPPVYDQTTPVMPYLDNPNYHLTEDLVDKTLSWLRQIRVTRPSDPFFCYVATGAMHCPHHVAPEWIEKFTGMFDDGWDALRQQIFERQLSLGVIPPGTRLTQRPEQIPSWDDYPDRYKPVASRLMEVFAGFLAHTDAQIGRILDELETTGQIDNTLVIYLTGDNGASAEGTIHGAWSAPSFQNGIHEDPEWLLEHIDDFGTARCENHYNVGWAWALDSPFQWMKQVASHFGGTRNAMALSWPARITDAGELRQQFHHVVDLMPTILDAAGVEMPDTFNGITQMPVEGTSMLYSFGDKSAPSRRITQYFEILGNRAIYQDGWIASCFHGRVPWIRTQGYEFDGPQEKWELYDVAHDFSQSVDLAQKMPEKLQELLAVFDHEAKKNNVYPLRDAGSPRHGPYAVPSALGTLTKMAYTTEHVRMPEPSVVNLKNCSFRISANVTTATTDHGVIACQGGNMAGWSLYLDDLTRPTFHYNWTGHEHYVIAATDSLSPGTHDIVVEFAYDGGLGGGGNATLSIDGVVRAMGRIDKTIPLVFSMSGETFDVGIDTGSPVGPYPHGYACTADISTVVLERLSQPPADIQRLIDEGTFRASLSTQ